MERKTKLPVQHYHFNLMIALIYPAILGSILFLVLSTFALGSYHFISIEFLFTIFMLFYFFVTFLDTFSLDQGDLYQPNYTWIPFIFDSIELIAIFYIFLNLGFSPSLEKAKTDLSNVYLLFGILQIIHPFWAWRVKLQPDAISIFTKILRVIICVIGYLGLYNSLIFNLLSISFFSSILLVLLMIDYHYLLTFESKINYFLDKIKFKNLVEHSFLSR